MRKAAFTLIELLVVIAIIAILASLAIPALTSALERGKSAKDANNLRQLGVGMIQFVNQNEDTMWAVAGTNGGGTWPTTLQQFVPDWRTFLSPFDNRPYTGLAPFSVSYGFNQKLFAISTAQFHYPSQLIVLAGAHNFGGGFTGTSNIDVLLSLPLPTNGKNQGGTFRNGTQLNVLYSDSHVQPILVLTYNDSSSTLGQQQWNPAAPLAGQGAGTP
jgi:prepilin-type N-terminal cleavage/methylation domain-containing protein